MISNKSAFLKRCWSGGLTRDLGTPSTLLFTQMYRHTNKEEKNWKIYQLNAKLIGVDLQDWTRPVYMQQYLHSAHASCCSKTLFVGFPWNAHWISFTTCRLWSFFSTSAWFCVFPPQIQQPRVVSGDPEWAQRLRRPARNRGRKHDDGHLRGAQQIPAGSEAGAQRGEGGRGGGGSAPRCHGSSQISSLLSTFLKPRRPSRI